MVPLLPATQATWMMDFATPNVLHLRDTLDNPMQNACQTTPGVPCLAHAKKVGGSVSIFFKESHNAN
jgi:hypothetical protein